MLIEDRKLFFPTALVILDDEEAIRTAKSKKYSRVTIISNNELDLPGFDVRSKMTGLIDLKSDFDATTSTFSKTTRNEIARTFRDEHVRFETNDHVPHDIY